MITITLKYTNYGHKETAEFRDYAKNLVGYRDGDYRFGKESDPMFDEKIVFQAFTQDEDIAFDIVNHFIIDREVNGDNIPFDIDISSISIYVSGSDAIMDYLTSKSFSNLYERLDSAENAIISLYEQNARLQKDNDRMNQFISNIGADKFPDIVKQLVESLEREGYECKQKINEILNRKVH